MVTIYQCEYCGSTFDTAEQCIKHERLHAKPVQIEKYCNYPLGTYRLNLYPGTLYVRMDDGALARYNFNCLIEKRPKIF